jgi:hypothetical protein
MRSLSPVIVRHLPPPYSNCKGCRCLTHVGREGRANGSTWELGEDFGIYKKDTVVPVDKDNLIEIWEDNDGGKIFRVQNAWVYFVGYILKGAYANFDDGKFYKYKAVLDPTNEGISTAGDVWDTYAIGSRTVSPNVVGVYWRLQADPTGSPPADVLYAREVGSTDTGLTNRGDAWHLIPGFPVNVDENGEVEYNMQEGDRAWIFGYVDEYVRRSRSKVTEI